MLAGRAILQSPAADHDIVATASDGHIIAGGQLAQALSEQLSSEDGSSVDIGLTFRSLVALVSGSTFVYFAGPVVVMTASGLVILASAWTSR